MNGKKASRYGNAAKKEGRDGKEDVVKGISSLFGKISGKEQLELEIDRLNSRIVELEIDIKTAQIQLEKREKLARDAVADKQEAESRLNQELVRMQTLTHELESLRVEASEKFEFRGFETLSLAAMRTYLFKIASFRGGGPPSSSAEELLTVYLPPASRLSDVLPERLLDKLSENTCVLLEKLDSETGLILFHDIHRMISEAIVPPLPINGGAWYLKDSFETSGLEKGLDADYRMLVLLLHAGESFVGFAPDHHSFENEELVRSSVKEKHTKGGFSQRRFERLREEDIAHHLEKVMEAVNRILEAREDIDCVIMSGDLQLMREVEKRLPFDLDIIEKSMDLKMEKLSGEEVLRAVLSCRRYLL
ncbi:MAG: Vms1/Ankzf1 family peptidyl-tRNA hydrolase [Methanosarcinaceae archaeon]|nr:Vms1/Ankzf1 family peptidyl-tRNA hydrolase [Methanosarcinaceae archaeon]